FIGSVGLGAIDAAFEFNVEGSDHQNIGIQTTGASKGANVAFISPVRGWDMGVSPTSGNFSIRDRNNSFREAIVIEPGAGSNKVYITASGDVGIHVVAPAGRMEIDQFSTTGAIPVLVLDQADVSEEMIEFQSTIGTGNAIEAVGAKSLTITHFIKVTIPGGLTRYFGVGTIA
ncbi:hypothetical protein LCGC14_2699110, partial [marine sediment metagenome]